MNERFLLVSVILGLAVFPALLVAQDEQASTGDVPAGAFPSTALPFVAISPCRLADTRSTTLPPGYGIPALGAGAVRVFTFSGRCGIPSTAVEAVSANLTVANTQGAGFIATFPTGTTQPNPLVSSLNYSGTGQVVANAAVIPLGPGGLASIIAGVSGADLIIDVNGYLPSTGLVTSVNAIPGDVTLAAGANVTVTPSGNTLTIATSGSSLPSGGVMFFDLTSCPAGWTPLAEAQGRTIVGLNPGGTLRGGGPTPALADQAARTITGPSAVPSHTHSVTNDPEAAHTHTVTNAVEAAHTHAHDHSAFTTTAIDGTHTHTTDTVGSAHSHSVFRNTGGGGLSEGVDVFVNLLGNASLTTNGAGTHTHGVTTTNSGHTHQIDIPNLPAGGPGTSHTHIAAVGAGTSHTHTATASTTGNASVDVTMPYVQLLACRKD